MLTKNIASIDWIVYGITKCFSAVFYKKKQHEIVENYPLLHLELSAEIRKKDAKNLFLYLTNKCPTLEKKKNNISIHCFSTW